MLPKQWIKTRSKVPLCDVRSSTPGRAALSPSAFQNIMPLASDVYCGQAVSFRLPGVSLFPCPNRTFRRTVEVSEALLLGQGQQLTAILRCLTLQVVGLGSVLMPAGRE